MDIKASRNFLIKKQIKKGDVIGIQMPNEYLFIVILLAIISIGAIANVFPTQISSEVLEKIYQQYQIKLLICSNKEDQKTSSFNTVTANEIYDNQLLPFVDTIAQNDLAVLYFTGGTTSQPKVVKLTHKNLMRGMTNGAYGFSKIMHLKYLTVIPFYHVFGLVRSALTPLYTGSENYLGNFSDVLKELTIVDPDIICTVPAMLEMICFFAKKDINILGKKHKTVVVGGAEINPILLKEANKLGIYACSGYGLTETTNLVSGSRFEAENASTAGHLFDFQEIKIVNHEL
jgi:long-chain acyl-CoA synthetase